MVRDKAFYISVLAPVAGILLVNLTVFIVVVVKVQGKVGQRNQNGQFLGLLNDMRIAFTCNVLLGCTWVFALFAVGKAVITFQWLFCIFNSLQGFFIFIFYVVRKFEVRNLFQKISLNRSKTPQKMQEISTISL